MAGNTNLNLSLGFRGQGKPNAIAAYVDNGAYLVGGFASLTDTQTAYFGTLMSSNPAGIDGEFFCGIPSGYSQIGIAIYEAGIAMNDAAKNNYVLTGQPMTVMQFGNLWLASWTKTASNAIDPIMGAVVIANNTSGAIEFVPRGSSAPTGWTAINASIKAVSDRLNGVMLFVNI